VNGLSRIEVEESTPPIANVFISQKKTTGYQKVSCSPLSSQWVQMMEMLAHFILTCC